MVAWCWRWWCYAVVTLGCTQMTLSHMHGTVVAVLVVLLPVVPMAKALYPGAWYGATAATKPTSGLHHAQPWSASVPMCHSETQWYSSGQRDAWSRLWRARSTRVGFTGDIDYGWSSHAMYIVTLSLAPLGKGTHYSWTWSLTTNQTWFVSLSLYNCRKKRNNVSALCSNVCIAPPLQTSSCGTSTVI
jgi:hypothetical protein